VMAEAKAFKMIPHCTKDTITYEMDELVMCKDCIHWDDHIEECSNSDSVCFRNGWTKPDWYCADGERAVQS
jgi:hypothetical protein